MPKISQLKVKDTTIRTFHENQWDYICITDIAAQKNAEEPKDVVKNWMRLKNTIEYLGFWEMLNNPDFKGVEFDPLFKAAGSNFGITAKEWRDSNPDKKGNIRDEATLNQLICLSNMENLNAVFIHECVPQKERLIKLNKIAIQQMEVLKKVEDRRLLTDATNA